MNKIIAFKDYQYPGDKLPAAELLRLYRTRSNLTQSKLAQSIGLRSDRVIRKWENGQSLPEASRLKKLIEFYITANLFTRFREEAEAFILWEAVKETFEFQSQTFETYTIFDKSWFAALTGKLYQGQVAEFPAYNRQTAEKPFIPISETRNFPVARDSFIGREKQLAQVREILDITRLLTITGPPGVGKTRFALEICPALTAKFKGGIFLVSLEFITDAEALPQAIAHVLGLGNAATVGPTQIFNFLQDKEILLVFDLFDRFVIDGSRFIDQLFKRCDKVKVIITSRESLGVSGETIFQLEPLEVMDNKVLANQADRELADFAPGIRLFAERAMAVKSDFEFNARTASVIARICHNLDDLPLAIELAASLVEVLAVEQIEARLNQPFQLLRRTLSNSLASDHLQSLTKNFELSFSRLNQEERLSLQRLFKLPGSFNLEMAEQMLVDGDLPEKDALELLENLVRKSLVRSQNVDEVVTFSILKTVRSYCLFLEKEGNYFGK